MGSGDLFAGLAREDRWRKFLLRVGVKIGWVAPLLHWGTAIAVGVLVSAGFTGVAATVGIFYLAWCVYDAEGHVLQALFDAEEERAGRANHDDAEEREEEVVITPQPRRHRRRRPPDGPRASS